MGDTPSDLPHPISHTLLRVCVCHIEGLCHTRLSPLSPALYVFPEVRGRHLQVCIHIRMSHRGSMSHTPITLISRARCHVHMYAYTCVCNVECVCHIECVSHAHHPHPNPLIEIAMVLSTNSGSFPSNSHVSATLFHTRISPLHKRDIHSQEK